MAIERTLSIIKPDAVAKNVIGQIYARFEGAGLKVVAVSQRVDHFPDRNETRDALDQRMITFLLFAGFIPVPVPNGLCRVQPEGRWTRGGALDRLSRTVDRQAGGDAAGRGRCRPAAGGGHARSCLEF